LKKSLHQVENTIRSYKKAKDIVAEKQKLQCLTLLKDGLVEC
jgi:hypothetical protein